MVRWEGRERDEDSNTVRHILIQPEDSSDETQMADAKKQAEDLLAQWKAGDATEDSFAELAKENSADTGSAAEGGLIADITPYSSYVENFLNWSTDDSRKPGDTDIVESTYGYHVMYFVGHTGEPWWKQQADSSLRSADLSDWMTAAQEGYEAKESIGTKFVAG